MREFCVNFYKWGFSSGSGFRSISRICSLWTGYSMNKVARKFRKKIRLAVIFLRIFCLNSLRKMDKGCLLPGAMVVYKGLDTWLIWENRGILRISIAFLARVWNCSFTMIVSSFLRLRRNSFRRLYFYVSRDNYNYKNNKLYPRWTGVLGAILLWPLLLDSNNSFCLGLCSLKSRILCLFNLCKRIILLVLRTIFFLRLRLWKL